MDNTIIRGIGLIAIDGTDQCYWTPRLTFADTPPTIWSPTSDAIPTPWMWVVALPTWYTPQQGTRWLRRLNAPTLLLTAHGEAALRTVGTVVQPEIPIVVADPLDAQRHLRVYLDWTMYVTYGHIWLPACLLEINQSLEVLYVAS